MNQWQENTILAVIWLLLASAMWEDVCSCVFFVSLGVVFGVYGAVGYKKTKGNHQ